MVFHWSLSDSKSPQVSRTLLSIQVDLNTAVFWMISTRPCIIIFIIIITSFFLPELGDGLSLESEWQQVYLSLQNSSQYSGRS